MERRVFLTLIACVLFTLVYFKAFPPAAPPKPLDAVPGAAVTDPAEPAGSAPADSAASAPSGDFAATDAPAVELALENSTNRFALTSTGAAVTQIWLKKFYESPAAAREHRDDLEHWVSLIPEAEKTFGATLVLRELAAASGRARYPLDRVNWAVASQENGPAGQGVTFRYQAADGMEFEKRLSLAPDEPFLRVQISLRTENPALAGVVREYLLRASGGIVDPERGQFTDPPKGVALQQLANDESKVDVFDANHLDGSPETIAAQGSARITAGGTSNIYFAMLLLPDVAGTCRGVDLRADNDTVKEKLQAELLLPIGVNRDGAATKVAFRYYAGPKDPVLFRQHGLGDLVPLVELDYGSWESLRWINKLLLIILRTFHDWIGNWGVAIILMTLLVRLCVFPITRTQQVSMQRYAQKMQVLKPKLDQLREKHQGNPQKYAQEQMKLLKEHGARPPVVGCLSSFITFPVFIGMFQILRSAIELRQAPFAGWIRDLSLPDHLFTVPLFGLGFNVLPILATGAFLWQMALAPKPDDPQARQQQKIMMFMPVVFGIMFYNYAAGLSLYMLTSSLYGIAESKFIRKRWLAPATAAAAARA